MDVGEDILLDSMGLKVVLSLGSLWNCIFRYV